MSQRRQRLYRRLDRAERAAIERGLDKNRPARAMARDLGRSQSSVADEVRRNRTVTRGPGQGVEGRVGARGAPAPGSAAGRTSATAATSAATTARCRSAASTPRPAPSCWPTASCPPPGAGWTARRRSSSPSPPRSGPTWPAACRPAQIADARSSEFRAAPSTIYRWIERGYAGMSNMDLRRKVGYRPRRRAGARRRRRTARSAPSRRSRRSRRASARPPRDGHGDRARRRPGSASSRSTCAAAARSCACFCPRGRRARWRPRSTCWRRPSGRGRSSACSG